MKLQLLTQLEKKLSTALARLEVPSSARVVVAVSGGADSVALLEALAAWQTRQKSVGQIIVAHLNHQLRAQEADEDEAFVRSLAATLGVEAVIERAPVRAVAQREKRNLEAVARRLRYEFLQRVAVQVGASVVCTAHTQDDQAETVLLRLLRGTGNEGLRGILFQQALGEGAQLLRPLLSVTRAEVLAHCAARNLNYRTDSSNFSLTLARNRVRHEVLPLLRTFNPRCAEALARTAEGAAEEEAFWQVEVQRVLAEVQNSAARLRLTPFLAVPVALRRRVWREWVKSVAGISLDVVQVVALERLLTHGQSGRLVELRGGWRVAREFAELRLEDRQTAEKAALVPPLRRWQTAEPLVFGAFQFRLQRGLSWAVAQRLRAVVKASAWDFVLRDMPELAELNVRTRRPGDAYVPAGKRQPVKLKTLLIRHKIAKPDRDAWPVLVTPDGLLLGGPGLPLAAPFALAVKTEAVDEQVAWLTIRKE